ncbi:MAG TPA: hypothetical protein VLL97_04555 [Acidobacteriota bacterium]|nr:hypothetical protein [Acidobacteriota bacterium]
MAWINKRGGKEGFGKEEMSGDNEEARKDRVKERDDQRRITRRDFAIGSMALLGARPLAKASTFEPLSGEIKAARLEIADHVRVLLDERHITEEDLRRVIDHAERTGEKLYQPGSDRLLSKLWAQYAYFYVEYSPVDGGYIIHTAYSHRLRLELDYL